MSTAPQWEPTAADIADARVTDFARFAGAPAEYHALWQWSVDEPAAFWAALWKYFGLGEMPGEVLAGTDMPGARWFPGARLNYVDQVVRQSRTDRPAILCVSEDTPTVELSWAELLSRTAGFAKSLTDLGVGAGDRVVGYLPNIAEAVIAFLGTAAVGAVWSACGQDYSAKAALDRLGQLEPVVLVTTDGYRFGGKSHDKSADVAALRAGLPTLRATVSVSRLTPTPSDHLDWDTVTSGGGELDTTAVEFDHPLWILFSSGTTGLPKGIIHGHGGVLLEHLKAVALQSDIGERDTFFWYTSPSWMMWNFQIAGLLVGATIVCYDGSPSYPCSGCAVGHRGRRRCDGARYQPGICARLHEGGCGPARPSTICPRCGLSGSPGRRCRPSTSLWMRDNVGEHVQVASISGGTDVVSAFIGGVRTVPVWPGELSAPFLGCGAGRLGRVGQPGARRGGRAGRHQAAAVHAGRLLE